MQKHHLILIVKGLTNLNLIHCLIVLKLKNMPDHYYKDGRQCKILDYNWAGDGKYTYVNNIVIRFDNGEIKEDVSGMSLYLTEKSLEKYGWYFKEDDY